MGPILKREMKRLVSRIWPCQYTATFLV